MATLEDLLHHLVRHAPELSEANRQEYHDLIDGLGAGHEPEPEPEPEPGNPEVPVQ